MPGDISFEVDPASCAVTGEYKGFKLRFGTDDKWCCFDLDIEDESLPFVKRKIDEIERASRNLRTRAIYLRDGREYTGEQCTVTLLCGPEMHWNESESARVVGVVHCFAMFGDDRRKISIDDLAPLDQAADVKAWLRLQAAAVEATESADAALEAISRHSADSLMLASKESEKPEKRRKRA